MSEFRFHITFNMVFFGLLSIVERFGPDHVGTTDDGCAYVAEVDGLRLVPSCIVGQFFSDLGLLRMLLVTDGSACGVLVKAIDGTRYTNRGSFNPETRDALAEWGITMDDDAHSLLWKTQIAQDDGQPWPKALEDALGQMITTGELTVVRPEVSSVDLVKHTLSL